MDMLVALGTFVRVSETRSFSAVAQERGTTQSAVSRQVTALEEELGVRLFQRTTRRLALTEDGAVVLAHAHEVLDAVEATREIVGRRRGSPSGHVRLALPVFAAGVLAANVPELLRRHPDLSLDLITGDREHDLIEERLDLWVRTGESTHASHVTRRIGTTRPVLVATPDYLDARGEPADPRDLQAHDCLVQRRYGDDPLWRFTGPGGEVTVPVAARFSADNGNAVLRATVAGAGIALLTDLLIRADIEAGRLRTVMTAYTAVGQPITVVYPSRRNLSPRVRVVIDFLVEALMGGSHEVPPEAWRI
jgi:DNA-binding transcriptional LysR family regulator